MADEQKANVVLTADNRQYDQSMQQSAKNTHSLTQAVLALSNGMNQLAQNTGKKMQLVSVGGVAALTAATAAAARFDSQMSTMQANAIMTGRSTEQMARNVNQLRGSFAVTTDQAIALNTQLAKMGQTGGIDRISAAMLKLGAVTGESVGTLTQGLISLQRQMGVEGPTYTEKFSSALANASAKAGVAASSVLDFSNSIAPVAKVAGLSTKEVLGFSTAFVKAGQDGGAAATAFSKVLTDINRSIQYGSPELAAYSNLLGVTTDQFKRMPQGEAAIQIFERIQEQGPAAIKTLERFGLDGIRTFKALQALGSQGGIRGAMKDVAAGYDDQTKFNKAADAAMDGMNDRLQTLSNNLQRVGESFGKAFVGPTKGVIGAINGVMDPLAGLLEGLGKIPGIAAAAGVALMGMAGTIVRSLGLLTGLSALRMMTGGTMAAGFRYSMAQRRGVEPPAFATRAAGSYARDMALLANGQPAKETRGAQRWFYERGRGLANILPVIPGGQGVGPNGRPLGPGLLSRTAAWGVRGAGAWTRMGLENLFARNVWNPFNTGNTTAQGAQSFRAMWGNRRAEFGRSGENMGNAFKEMGQRTLAAFTHDPAVKAQRLADAETTRAARVANAELNAMGRAARNQTGVTQTLIRETISLSGAMAKATGGALMMGAQGGKMVVGGAMNAGVGLAKGIWGAASSFLGPVGLGLAGIGLVGSQINGYRRNQEAIENAGKETTAEDATGGAYKVALGHAARATTTFADIVLKNANKMSGDVLFDGNKITSYLAAEAQKPGRQFEDKKFGSMSYKEAQSYVQTAQLSQTEDERKVMAMDLVKAYGVERAQKLLDSTDPKNPEMELSGLFSDLKGQKQGWSIQHPSTWLSTPWSGPLEQSAIDRQKQAGGTTGANLAEIDARYGKTDPTATGRYTVATFNSMMQAINNGADKSQLFNSVANQLGYDVNDKNWDQFNKLFGSGVVRGADGQLHQEAAGIDRASRLLSADPKLSSEGFGKMLYDALNSAGSGFDRHSTKWTPYAGDQVSMPYNPYTNIDQNMMAQLTTNKLGKGIFDGDTALGKTINAALSKEGDANQQQVAMRKLGDEAIKTSDSFADATRAMQEWKGNIKDPSSPAYQLAANAQAYIGERQAYAQNFMSRADRVGQNRQNYISARAYADTHPDAPEAEQEARAEQSKHEQDYVDAYNTFKSLATAQRDLGIQQQRARTAFNLQGNQVVNGVEGYGLQDYNQQRKWAEDDFQRSRQRQEDSYGRQLQRQVRDYNRSRSYAQADFNKQRKRSEEDYQHQVQLMIEQSARSLYNAYDRIQTTRSWDAQNLLGNVGEQNQAMANQVSNLKQVRSMGISGDVIKMLGLNETTNAQQLARFVSELLESPELVKQYNASAKQRLALGKKLVTDEDNTQWTEMERSFKRNTTHAITDFDESMNRQKIAFATGLQDMRTEYNIAVTQAGNDFARMRDRQAIQFQTSTDRMVAAFNLSMQQAKDDLSTSATEIEGSFDTLADKAMSGLNSTAQKQLTNLRSHFGNEKTEIKKLATDLATDLTGVFASFGVDLPSAKKKQAPSGYGQSQHGEGGGLAAGGEVPGWSPHPKADNIPAMLTAGEYVQPVDTVDHYGRGFMDAVRTKRFPKEAAQHYADGGLVAFGRQLQKLHYQVSEHPLFGGVHPVHTKNSWHYKAGAIDVNHDQSDEKAAINKIINMARQYGLRTIWQVANHFDHAHFDISPGPDMIGPGVPTGKRAVGGAGGTNAVYDIIKNLKSVKKLEKIVQQGFPMVGEALGDNYFAHQLADALMGGGGPGDVVKAGGPSDVRKKANQALGRQMAAARGWTGPNWDALNWIYMKESGWDQYADNPTSDAYGIPQALPGSKMASAGSDWQDNPATQLKWGLGYIKERYGNPVKAQQFWRAHNWYGNGAIFGNGGQMVGVGERGPEMILPLNQQGVDYMLAVMKQFTAADAKRAVGVSRGMPVQSQGSVNYYSRIDRSTTISGPITVQSNDPRDMLRKLEAQKRIDALTSPRSSR